MIWLYHLQQRLSITRQEGLAILTLTLLFITGLTVRHVQEQQLPPLAVEPLVAQPVSDTAGSASPASPPSPSADNPLDLNAASLEALQTLPGIGPALAERIDRYRSTQRPFQNVRELRRVRGIGRKTMQKLRPLVDVSPPSESTD